MENTAGARDVLEQVIQYKKEMYEKIRRKAAEVQIHLARRREELKGLEHKIGNLEKRKLSYPESVERCGKLFWRSLCGSAERQS